MCGIIHFSETIEILFSVSPSLVRHAVCGERVLIDIAIQADGIQFSDNALPLLERVPLQKYRRAWDLFRLGLNDLIDITGPAAL